MINKWLMYQELSVKELTVRLVFQWTISLETNFPMEHQQICKLVQMTAKRAHPSIKLVL